MTSIGTINPNTNSPAGPNNSGQPSTDLTHLSSRSITDIKDLFRNPQLPDTSSSKITDDSRFNLDGEYRPEEIAAPKRWFQTIIDFASKALSSSKGLCTGLITQLNSWSKGLLRNPTALAWCSGLGAFVVAVMAVKNIFHGINVAVGRREEAKMPSLAYLFQGLLQGGLTAALLSPILGWRNPFAARDGDRLTVSKKMMVGGLVAPALMGLGILLAEGNTFLNRIPVIGTMLGTVASTPFEWLKSAFASTDKTVPSATIPGAATAGQ